jgi:2-methylcitrate dehydratase PrpD
MATRSQELAEAIAGFDPEAFGTAPMAKAKLCLLDFLGCALESVDLAPSRQAVKIAAGAPGAHMIGADRTSTPGDAAFANAVMGHGLVREDMHPASIAHHGVVVWPALLALAEEGRISGGRLLGAAVLAYEVGCRLGRMLIDESVAALYRPTGLVAPLGAAAGGAWMLGLRSGETASAIALAANTSSGLNQWPRSGGSEMFFHPGWAARNALTAVRLAEAGAFASPDILEGPAGLFAAFGRRAMPGPVALFPNGSVDMLNVYHKAAPACNFAQTACQSALRLVEELGSGAAPVTAIEIGVPKAAATYPGCDSLGPFERPLQAKMSIPFGVAAVFAHRRLAEANYRDLGNPEVLRLVAATRLAASDELSAAFPASQGATVEATLADGRRVSIALPDVAPATEAEVRERFRLAAGSVLGSARADQIEIFVDQLEGNKDAGRLARLCSKLSKPAQARSPSARAVLDPVGRAGNAS